MVFKRVSEMNATELAAEIEDRDTDHKQSQKHLKALLRCLKDNDESEGQAEESEANNGE